FIFFVCMLAETNRAPFDLPEAEAELVAGYNIEYSGISFALFFLAEYGNMILISSLFVFLFFSGWNLFDFYINFVFFYELFLATKIIFICFLFVIVRAAFPRCRYDQLMELCLKYFLLFVLSYYFLIICIMFANIYFPILF